MNNEFIESIKDGAIRAQMEYGICAALTIAQAILESGWGKYAVGNNLFGIKWQDGCGYDKQLVPTTEYMDGQRVSIEDWFRKYESWAESVYDHAQFLVANSRYSNLLGVLDYQVACRLIQEDGYATDPNYTNLLMQIIEENELYKYDVIEIKDIEEENDMKRIVTYFGDGDLFAAVLVAQRNQCPLIKKTDFDASGLKAEEEIQIGGKPGTDRFDSFKIAAALL